MFPSDFVSVGLLGNKLLSFCVLWVELAARLRRRRPADAANGRARLLLSVHARLGSVGGGARATAARLSVGRAAYGAVGAAAGGVGLCGGDGARPLGRQGDPTLLAVVGGFARDGAAPAAALGAAVGAVGQKDVAGPVGRDHSAAARVGVAAKPVYEPTQAFDRAVGVDVAVGARRQTHPARDPAPAPQAKSNHFCRRTFGFLPKVRRRTKSQTSSP